MVVEHPLGQDSATAADNPCDAALHLRQVLNQQASVDGLVIDALLTVLLDDVEEIILIQLFDRAMHALQRLIHGHRAVGTDEAMMAVRTSSRLTPPVERSITVSAPYFTANFSFFTSSAASDAFRDAPMLAFTLHLLAMPIAIGSRLAWLMLAGMIMRPRATSSMISDSGRFSHWLHRPSPPSSTDDDASRVRLLYETN